MTGGIAQWVLSESKYNARQPAGSRRFISIVGAKNVCLWFRPLIGNDSFFMK